MPKVSEEYYEKKRREIIDAAYRVCARKPITSVEMKDIIAETGFSHGVIYRYYKDLDEIFKDLVITINSENRIDDRLDDDHIRNIIKSGKRVERFDLYARLELGRDVLVREANRMIPRIEKSGIEVERDKLDAIMDAVDKQEVDYYSIIGIVENIMK